MKPFIVKENAYRLNGLDSNKASVSFTALIAEKVCRRSGQCSRARFNLLGLYRASRARTARMIHTHKYVVCMRDFTLSLPSSGASARAWPDIFHLSSSTIRLPLPFRGLLELRDKACSCFPLMPSPSRDPAHSVSGRGQASRRRAVAKLPTQARDLLRPPLGLGDGPLHGLGALPELLARHLLRAVGGVRGLPLGGRRHGGPLVDGRAPGRYYPVDNVPLRLGRPPARAYAHDVARPQRVVWVVDQVALEVLEVLWWRERIR